MKKLREMTVEDLPFQLSGMHFMGKYRPAVNKNEYGYSIRVFKGQSFSRSGETLTQWEYFTLDKKGMITASPRGEAKFYNKKVVITNIKEAVKTYKDPSSLRN